MRSKEKHVQAVNHAIFFQQEPLTQANFSQCQSYKKNGFIPTSEGDMLYLSIEGNYDPPRLQEVMSLCQDKNKAIIFYVPSCQFGYLFREKDRETNKRSSIQHQNRDRMGKATRIHKTQKSWLIVNAKPIHTFFKQRNSRKK